MPNFEAFDSLEHLKKLSKNSEILRSDPAMNKS